MARSSRKQPPQSALRSLDIVADAGHDYMAAAHALDEAVAIRNAAILVASEQGFSRRAVARAAGVTVGRVQQVLSAAPSNKTTLAQSLVRLAVDRLPSEHRDRYQEEWAAEIEAMGPRSTARLAFALSLLAYARRLGKTLDNGDATQTQA